MPNHTGQQLAGRKVARVRKQVRKVKQRKTRHIRIRMFQQQKEHREWQREWRMATWNTRWLGATTGYINQELKIQCLLTRMALQRWGSLLLTSRSGKMESEHIVTGVSHGIWYTDNK